MGVLTRARVVVASSALGALAYMCLLQFKFSATPSFSADAIRIWLLIMPVALALAAAALLTRRWWGRWLGLSAGLVSTLYGLWTVVVYADRPGRWPLGADAFWVGPILLACLAGCTMFREFDEPAGWRNDVQTRLVRWTVITNVASLVSLVGTNLLLLRYWTTLPFLLAMSATALLFVGAALLAKQKTAGLLLTNLGTVALLIVLGVLWSQAGSATREQRVFILATLVLPGVLFSFATIVVFARPMLRFWRRI